MAGALGAGGTRRGVVELGEQVKNRLKVLRAERDWSQAELGGRLGVSRQAVNAIETGKYDPSLPLAFKLSRLFDVPIEEIFDDGFGGSGDAR
jgi:putative transcriptional regulator